jgi:hypothetical protein
MAPPAATAAASQQQQQPPPTAPAASTDASASAPMTTTTTDARRFDRRQCNQLRPPLCELGPLNRADGSARFAMVGVRGCGCVCVLGPNMGDGDVTAGVSSPSQLLINPAPLDSSIDRLTTRRTNPLN